MLYRRPDSVTAAGLIICVFAIYYGLSSLLGLSSADNSSGSWDAISQLIQGFAAVGMLGAGANALRGENWARWFYVVLCGALFAYDVAFLRDELYAQVPAAVLRAISLALLFLPNANRYYASGATRI